MRMSSNYTVSIQMLLLMLISDNQKITSDIISQSTGANPVLIRQLYKKLKEAGIIKVSTGQGVTTLSKDPKEITLWDIYMAVEKYNVEDLFKFHPKISDGCQIGRFFKEILSPHLENAIEALSNEMASVSLFQLASEWSDLNKEASIISSASDF